MKASFFLVPAVVLHTMSSPSCNTEPPEPVTCADLCDEAADRLHDLQTHPTRANLNAYNDALGDFLSGASGMEDDFCECPSGLYSVTTDLVEPDGSLTFDVKYYFCPECDS
jgi:hypothetical protein